MTIPATKLGVTFACRDGFDASFRVATTDREIVADEVYHRMTTDSVLGDTPEAINWGKNIFRECGGTVSDAKIKLLGPTYSAVLQGSPLVEHADVVVTRASSRTDLVDLLFEASVTPKNPITDEVAASLTFIFRLTGDTFELVGDPDGGA